MTQLPNFLVIGAEKAGTTWLKHNLRGHPAIFVPAEKELHFFDTDENWLQGIGWYSQFFKNVTVQTAVGEITPGYLFSEAAPRRIFEVFPMMKLIVILRNPADRAYSNYQMNLADGLLSDRFDDLVKDSGAQLLQKGLYAKQIKRYLSLFAPEQLLILRFEELSEPQKLLSKIFSHLEVDPGYQSVKATDRIFSARRARFPWLNSSLLSAAKQMRRNGLGVVVEAGHKLQIRKLLKKYNTVTSSYKPMANQTRHYLYNYYRSDIDELEKLLNWDLSEWKQ